MTERDAAWLAWWAKQTPPGPMLPHEVFDAAFDAGVAAERERTAPKSWTQVYETTDSPAEDGIWRAIHERIGWGYSGVSGAREMEANEDIRRAIAAIRVDERERTAELVALVRRALDAMYFTIDADSNYHLTFTDKPVAANAFESLRPTLAILRAYEEGVSE